MIPLEYQLYTTLISLVVVFGFWWVHYRLNPYKIPFYNLIEWREYLCSIITLYCTFLFINWDNSTFVSMTILGIIVIFNVFFWASWLYVLYIRGFTKRLQSTKIITIAKFVAWMKAPDYYGDLSSKNTTTQQSPNRKSILK